MASVRIHAVAFQMSVGSSRRFCVNWRVAEVRTEFGVCIGGRIRNGCGGFQLNYSLDGVDDGKVGKDNGVVNIQKYVARSVDAVGEFRKTFVPSVMFVMEKCVKRSEIAVEELRGVVRSLPPVTIMTSRYDGKSFTIGLGIAIVMLFVTLRVYALRK